MMEYHHSTIMMKIKLYFFAVSVRYQWYYSRLIDDTYRKRNLFSRRMSIVLDCNGFFNFYPDDRQYTKFKFVCKFLIMDNR